MTDPLPPDGPRDLLLRAQRALVGGALVPAAVHVRGDRIHAVLPADAPAPDGAEEMLLGAGSTLLPGVVDSHVHVNDPGRAEWEGFPTALRAAAAGGVTTIVDMPLNSVPPTTTPEHLAVKVAAVGSPLVDVAFWGGAVPENLGTLAALKEAGVRGVKAFTSPSGVPEFGHLSAAELDRMLAECAELDLLAVIHAEDPAHLGPDGQLGRSDGPFLSSRPPAAESSAIGRVLAAALRTGARAHILHLSDAGCLPLLRTAREEGARVTVETCPHYLTFTAEEIPDGGTEFKCCPPIRGEANREALWEAVASGEIDAVVSDHSPSTPDLKRRGGGDFGVAWGGVSSLQVAFSATWTGARARGISLATVMERCAAAPARIAGLDDVGRIAPGMRANLVEYAPDAGWVVSAASLEHRNPVSAYDGSELAGLVRRTWVGGECVLEATDGLRVFSERRPGRLLLDARAVTRA